VQVVDKSPKKTGPNQQSNNKAKKDTFSDLTDCIEEQSCSEE